MPLTCSFLCAIGKEFVIAWNHWWTCAIPVVCGSKRGCGIQLHMFYVWPLLRNTGSLFPLPQNIEGKLRFCPIPCYPECLSFALFHAWMSTGTGVPLAPLLLSIGACFQKVLWCFEFEWSTLTLSCIHHLLCCSNSFHWLYPDSILHLYRYCPIF